MMHFRSICLRVIAPLLFLLLAVAPSIPTYAATNPFTGINCARASDAAVCQRSTGDPIAGKNGVLHDATLLIATIAGVAAVIVMVLAGIRYIVSNGDAEQIAKSKRTIILASVGLVIIVVGQAIINLVISKV